MLVTSRKASPTWSGEKTGKPKIDLATSLRRDHYLQKYCVDRLSIHVYLRLKQTWTTRNWEHFSVVSCNILSTPQCAATLKSTITVLGLNCSTLSLRLAGHILVQKLDFWDGNAINCSKISASIRLVYCVRLFKNNKQPYNVIPAKQYSHFFSATIFQLTNVNTVSVATCQDSSFRSVLSRNRNSSDGTATRPRPRRLRYRSSNLRRARNYPSSKNAQFWGLPSLLFNKHQ
jgi:hypothetical protein